MASKYSPRLVDNDDNVSTHEGASSENVLIDPANGHVSGSLEAGRVSTTLPDT